MKTNIWNKLISSALAILLSFELIPVQAYAAVTPDLYNDPESAFSAYDIPEGDFSNEKIIADSSELTEEIPDRRDEFQKVFMMENGMHLAAVYPMAVHYDKDGEWDEIDNTLYISEEESGRAYRNTAGKWDVYLPVELNDNNGITTVHDGYEFSFRLAGELVGDVKGEPPDEPKGYTDSENTDVSVDICISPMMRWVRHL